MTDRVNSGKQPVLPGATLGVFGSGQLGRMFAVAAKSMGYRVLIYSPAADSPAGQVADQEWVGDYEDLDRVQQFAESCQAITLEFENIPTTTVEAANQWTPVCPGHQVLHIVQNRVREKSFLDRAGLPVPAFRRIESTDDLAQADASLFPGVLKTSEMGYDGKGQVMVGSLDEAVQGWQQLETHEAILEQRIDFQCELSIIAARTQAGKKEAFPPVRNDHQNHILDVSVCPSGLPTSVLEDAKRIAFELLDALEYVGLLCVEFFLTSDERLLINEIAPRPHNSGHLTIEGHVTSQFEQQVRAICGLPFGSTQVLAPSAMVNLLGDLWLTGEPNWANALEDPRVKLHLYGKQTPKPGRKMGHLTATGDSPEQAVQAALAARERLQG